MCWVMPPASPATTFASRIRSSSLVLPWSTWPMTVMTGGRGSTVGVVVALVEVVDAEHLAGARPPAPAPGSTRRMSAPTSAANSSIISSDEGLGGRHHLALLHQEADHVRRGPVQLAAQLLRGRGALDDHLALGHRRLGRRVGGHVHWLSSSRCDGDGSCDAVACARAGRQDGRHRDHHQGLRPGRRVHHPGRPKACHRRLRRDRRARRHPSGGRPVRGGPPVPCTRRAGANVGRDRGHPGRAAAGSACPTPTGASEGGRIGLPEVEVGGLGRAGRRRARGRRQAAGRAGDGSGGGCAAAGGGRRGPRRSRAEGGSSEADRLLVARGGSSRAARTDGRDRPRTVRLGAAPTAGGGNLDLGRGRPRSADTRFDRLRTPSRR